MIQKKESGIDIDSGNRCSQIAFSWAKKTFTNRPEKKGRPILHIDGSFANIVELNRERIGISSDGIGTKIELAERTGIYDTLGYDLVAMVADDLVANGIEPMNISNILDVDFLDADIVNELMKGLHDACKFANIVVTGGEIAELGSRIAGYGDKMHFNWCATGIGFVPENCNLIDGSRIKPGDAIISLASQGFRSNGFSLIRNIMAEHFGAEWHETAYNQQKTWGEVLLTPSKIYAPIIVKLIHQKFELKGIAHITGGGLIDNVERILAKRNLGAILDNLFPPLEFMSKIQSMGEIEEQIAYRLWNMGNDMLIFVEKGEAENILLLLKKSNYNAKIAGRIVDSPKLTIHSLGCKPQHIEINFIV